MKTNEYAGEKRIVHKRNFASVHTEEITEGAEDIKHVGEHLTTEEAEVSLGKQPNPGRRHEGQTEYIGCIRCNRCNIVQFATVYMSIIKKSRSPPSRWLVKHPDNVSFSWFGRCATPSNVYKIGRQN